MVFKLSLQSLQESTVDDTSSVGQGSFYGMNSFTKFFLSNNKRCNRKGFSLKDNFFKICFDLIL